MSPEQDRESMLRALADADRGEEAAPELEVRVRLAFRRKMRKRRWKRIAVWTSAAAAILIAMFVGLERKPKHEQAVILPKQVDVPAQDVAPLIPPPVQRVARTRHAVQSREVVTDFFPLIEGAPPVERGELVRVNLSAAAMQAVGLPVREDRLSERVQADVLVSEEGLATAIRFVKVAQ